MKLTSSMFNVAPVPEKAVLGTPRVVPGTDKVVAIAPPPTIMAPLSMRTPPALYPAQATHAAATKDSSLIALRATDNPDQAVGIRAPPQVLAPVGIMREPMLSTLRPMRSLSPAAREVSRDVSAPETIIAPPPQKVVVEAELQPAIRPGATQAPLPSFEINRGGVPTTDALSVQADFPSAAAEAPAALPQGDGGAASGLKSSRWKKILTVRLIPGTDVVVPV